MKKMKDGQSFGYCQIDSCTDVGRKRKANEDSMGTFETVNGLMSVVCDGMGGHVGGEMASRIAVDTIHGYMNRNLIGDPREAIGLAIEEANKAIIGYTRKHPELEGMGATCVLLLIRDAKVYIGHVGDSRIYLIRDRHIIQLTKDHSFVQTLVDEGRLTHEEAEHHPRKNEITNALGIADMQPATVRQDPIDPEEGDCFLLCSDGLSGMVSDKEMEHIISRKFGNNIHGCANSLVNHANEKGGLDNITVQLVKFSFQKKIPGNKKMTGKWISLILLCIVIISLFIFLFPRFSEHTSRQEMNQETEKNVDGNIEGDMAVDMVVDYSIENLSPSNGIGDNSTQSHQESVRPLLSESQEDVKDFVHKLFPDATNKRISVKIPFGYDGESTLSIFPDGRIMTDYFIAYQYTEEFNLALPIEVSADLFIKEPINDNGVSFIFTGVGYPAENIQILVHGKDGREINIILTEKVQSWHITH